MVSATIAPPEVRRVASSGLAPEGPVIRVPEGSWSGVLSRLDHHRLTGIAVAAWETDRLELEPGQADELLDHQRAAMCLALSIERQLVWLADVFDRAGVRIVVLKGPAVAHYVYPDPAMRPFGDLDLLVSGADWHLACEVLRSNGYTRTLPEPRAGFDERFGKAATHVDETGLQVDLHRTFVLGPFGLWLDPEELLARTETFVLGGKRLERLDATGMLLNAALHAGLGATPPLLLPIRDVAQAARQPWVDWNLLAAWAKRWHLGAALRYAFDLVDAELQVELPEQAHGVVQVAGSPSEVRALRAYTDRRRRGGVAIAATMAIPGVRAKAAYLSRLVLPSREFLRARAAGSGPRATYRSRWRIPLRWITPQPGRGQSAGKVVADDR